MYSYKHWLKGLDVQLLKRIQLWLADKLRTILLLKADQNMNNKAIGADAMKMGELRAVPILRRTNDGIVETHSCLQQERTFTGVNIRSSTREESLFHAAGSLVSTIPIANIAKIHSFFSTIGTALKNS